MKFMTKLPLSKQWNRGVPELRCYEDGQWYILRCSTCGDRFEYNNTRYFTTGEEAAVYAIANKWYIAGASSHCSSCVRKPGLRAAAFVTGLMARFPASVQVLIALAWSMAMAYLIVTFFEVFIWQLK